MLEPRIDNMPDVQYFGVIPEVWIRRKTSPAANWRKGSFAPFREFVGYGRALMEAGDSSFKNVKIDRDAICAILFTSGTTGTSKGVMLSHRNIANAINGSWRMIDVGPVMMLVSVPPDSSYL